MVKKESFRNVNNKGSVGTKNKFGEFQGSLILNKLPGYFLIFCLIASIGYLFYILWPLLTAIFIAAILVIAFYPIYRKFLKFFRGRASIASFFSTIFVLLLIVVPLTIFGFLVVSEGIDAYRVVDTRVQSGEFDQYLQWQQGGIIYDLIDKFKIEVGSVVDWSQLDLKQNILNTAQTVSSKLTSFLTGFIDTLLNFILNIFVMLFSMYYFFKDGDKLVDKLGYMSPLPSVYEKELFIKIGSMVKAIVFGVFFAAILQGVAGGIGFIIVGISNPVFWGAVMAFLSLLPVIGTAIVWVPGALILVILGQYWSALFLLIWGMLVIGSLDNIARTYLIGGKAKTYPLMTFFVILGGVLTMSLKGVLVGPLVLMVLMSFLHIYEAEYLTVLKR